MKKYYCSFWGDEAGEGIICHDIIEAGDIKDAIEKLIEKWGGGFFSGDIESINECIRIPGFLQNRGNDDILIHYNKLYEYETTIEKDIELIKKID